MIIDYNTAVKLQGLFSNPSLEEYWKEFIEYNLNRSLDVLKTSDDMKELHRTQGEAMLLESLKDLKDTLSHVITEAREMQELEVLRKASGE